MRQHFTEFSSIAERDPNKNLPSEKYLDKIARPHQMVGDYLLDAATNVIQKSITLYCCGLKPQLYSPAGDADTDADKECICLLYGDASSANAGHYQASVSICRSGY